VTPIPNGPYNGDMNEGDNDRPQREKSLVKARNPEGGTSLDRSSQGSPEGVVPATSDSDVEEESVEDGLGVDPIQTLLNRRYPRIALHRDTLRLLQRVEWASRNQGVNNFCNDAIRYVILARESGTITFNDLHAVCAALDARLDELSVILLHLHQAVGDLSIIVEHQRLIGAYGERLKKAATTARSQ